MSDKRKDQYASAIFEIATAEGNIDKISGELYAFSQALEKSRELYVSLSDNSIPFEKRNQIVLDLLSNKASAATLGVIVMLVSAGRIKDLPDISKELSVKVAEQQEKEVAYVRSAVSLSDEQLKKLREALNKATNKQLDLKVTVDEELLGGITATIGDTVIDGTVKSRLQKLREKLEAKQ